jgi:2-polyprenyl-3-methyl-5-hydroxy-6-metoxy-1,4-benzoquinol methylase
VRRRLERVGRVDYQVSRSNDQWADHRARTLVTAGLIAWMQPELVCDPACGDGSIVLTANRLAEIDTAVMGDISRPSIERLEVPDLWHKVVGAIETTLTYRDLDWDVTVLTETLEHLEDPDGVLQMARRRSRALVASSPCMRPGQVDDNPEHLWMFDASGFQEMLKDAGWDDVHHTVMKFHTMYDFQVWVCV